MEDQVDIQILAAERLNDGIVVKFGDGSCFFYSVELLAETIPQAKKLDEPVAEW